jgi:hypothetical protein
MIGVMIGASGWPHQKIFEGGESKQGIVTSLQIFSFAPIITA